ncbi:hypothetical protein [Levilinea saccharolytica]|uniref:hypothetical protein n=1 Tax=Levilinea saccharolytica TaxID=229921 RepID=UPI001F38ED99|nr:hypothetical protein [Levilinea saccharolytica]
MTKIKMTSKMAKPTTAMRCCKNWRSANWPKERGFCSNLLGAEFLDEAGADELWGEDFSVILFPGL